MSRAVVFLCVFFIITAIPLSADQELDQALLTELAEKVKQAYVPESTLEFVLKRLNVGLLPEDRGQAVETLLDLVKRYDAEFRKGKSFSRLNLELKREMLLSKEKKVKVGEASVIKVKEKIKTENATAQKEKKITAVKKEKIEEKKEKEIKEKKEIVKSD